MLKKKLTVILFVLSILALPLLSKSKSAKLELKLKNALSSFKSGKKDLAIKYLNDSILIIVNSYNLGIKELLFINSEKGYRQYIRKNNNVFSTGDSLLLYIEPIGYKVVKNGDMYHIKVSQDAKIIDSKGKVKFERKDWVTMDKSFVSPLIPFYITNSIDNISQLENDTYTYEITINDLLAGKFYKKSIKFIVKK